MALCHIPSELLPADGRFGSGPTRIRPAQAAWLAGSGASLMGTSHRQSPVKNLVGHIQERLRDFYRLPPDYQVVLGNGGASAFWEIAVFNLIAARAQFAAFGEFGQKFADAAARAPFLANPQVRSAPPGEFAACVLSENDDDAIDAYCYPHNETSTGVTSPIKRFGGSEALTIVDGTSAAGAIDCDLQEVDAYYFSPQKALGSDGGLWIAILSPAALARAAEINATRYVPQFFDLPLAAKNSAAQQTLNTPALATLILLANQLDWLADRGGLAAADQHCRSLAELVYQWAEERPWAKPLVEQAQYRSPTVATIALDPQVAHAAQVAATLRAHGIVDVEPYRKYGSTHLRFGLFPSVPLADVRALLACIDYLVAHDPLGAQAP